MGSKACGEPQKWLSLKSGNKKRAPRGGRPVLTLVGLQATTAEILLFFLAASIPGLLDLGVQPFNFSFGHFSTQLA